MQSLRDRVARVFYTHGLFCASHPVSILVTVCTVIVILCYPLLYTPLPGNAPVEYTTPRNHYRVPPDMYEPTEPRMKPDDGTDVTSIPRWYKGLAVGYAQQIVVKTTVSPWDPTQHDPLDALRGPLRKVFDILDLIDKFRHQHGGEEKSMVNCCLRVSEPIKSKHSNGLLPEYACLVLSPANLWQKNLNKFIEDQEVLKPIYKRYSLSLEVPPGIRDLLFGLPWKKTGISRYFIRNKQRTISFAITLVLKAYDESFVTALRDHLETVYPDTVNHVNNSEIDHIAHLHYKDINIYSEYMHLIVVYIVILMYMYFSVQKIEMVKSKWGLALSAVVTVVSSLLISASVCSIFGMNSQMQEIFPYLVVFIGMENILVVTKSVTSTSIDLDVKCRVATGLSKEGWSITKNLLTELAIVFVGFFTFVPAIQEFCLFALVGLLTDFFLQMIFFVTVLCVDIRRMELSDLHKHKQDTSSESKTTATLEPIFRCPFKSHLPVEKIRPIPRLSLSSGMSMLSTQVQSESPRVQHEAQLFQNQSSILDLPRRLRLIYFWANTRVVQRFIMVCSVIWIVLIVYKSGLVHHLTNSSYTLNETSVPRSAEDLEQIIKQQEQTSTGDGGKIEGVSPLAMLWGRDEEKAGSVKHNDLETWRSLSHNHWITLFGHYNITIMGKYISILPTIHLSIIVPPEDAIRIRVPSYKSSWPEHTRSNKLNDKIPVRPKLPDVSPVTLPTLEKAKDKNKDKVRDPEKNIQPETQMKEPEFLSEEYLRKNYPYMDPDVLKQIFKQYYPKSHLEFVITVSLGILSVICISYFILALYRCLCSRKYSKWRASWNKSAKYGKSNNYFKQIKEAVPIVLKGHLQEIECLVTDGSVIISSCLGGQLRVWDSFTGECLHSMQRKVATPPMRRKPCEGSEDSDAELYMEYHGNHNLHKNDLDLEEGQVDRPQPRHRKNSERKESKSSADRNQERFEKFPDLKPTIEVNFMEQFKTKPEDKNKRQMVDTSYGTCDRVGECVEASLKGGGIRNPSSAGFDFKSRFGEMYSDHERLSEENKLHDSQRRSLSEQRNAHANRSKSWSEGEFSSSDIILNDSLNLEMTPSPIWCLACKGNLIVAGCGNGKIEFWDSTSGVLKCLYGERDVGVTGLNFIGKRVIVARLDGSIDFLELETFQGPKLSTPLSPSSLNRKIKGHSRHLSHSRTGSDDLRLWMNNIHCTQVQRTQAHQRPITVLQAEGGRIVSGSQDFTLKVFRLEDFRCLYTLHGHTASITVLYLDKCPPYAAVSGSADGTLRLWDLLTGTCVHKIRGHEGTVTGLTCTDIHMISSGLDDKMCVWERKRGHLLYSVDMETSCGNSMSMLSNNFLVTGGQGSLYLWDVHKGELVRVVNLQNRERISFIHHIQSMENSTIVCDYGNEIKVIHFPLVLEKRE